MTPDYSNCSISELQEILRVIDGQAKPENKAAAEAELLKRLESDEYKQQHADTERASAERIAKKVDFAQSAVPVIAWFLMATAPVFFFLSSAAVPPDQLSAGSTILGASVIYGACCLVAGYGLRARKSWGYGAAILVLTVQAISVASKTFSLKVISVFGVYFTVSLNGDIGFAGLFDPGLTFVANPALPLEIGLNLFAIFLIWLLITAWDGGARIATDNALD